MAMRWTRAAVACAAIGGAVAINAPQIYTNSAPQSPEQTAICVVDVNQAVFSLGQAGMAVRAATRYCKPPILTKSTQSDCAVSINSVITFLSLTAEYLAAAASNCGSTLNLDAYCAADVSSFVGSLGVLAAGASDMSKSCKAEPFTLPTTKKRPTPPPRRLEQTPWLEASAPAPARQLASNKLAELFKRTKELQELKQLKQDREAAIAECFFNVGQAALWLTQAGLALDGAVKDCSAFSTHIAGARGQMLCSVDINGVLGSFAWVSRSLSLAVTQCPVNKNRQAQCAASISSVIAGLAGVGASGSSFALTCGRAAVQGASPTPAAPVDRRLQLV